MGMVMATIVGTVVGVVVGTIVGTFRQIVVALDLVVAYCQISGRARFGGRLLQN